MGRRYSLITLGCPKNEVDSEGISCLLETAGYAQAEDSREADFLIVNTCGFVEAARQESLEVLRELAAQKSPHQQLVAVGCMGERHRMLLSDQVPDLAATIGAQRWSEVPALLGMLGQHETRGCPVVLPPTTGGSSLVRSFSRSPSTGASAYLKIADGCSISCAFCAIPLIKGPQRSKAPADVLREAQELVAQGVKEIVLIAQDTTAYLRDQGQRNALPGLLEDLLGIMPEQGWLRIMYAYPQHVTGRLVEVMACYPRVCRYLDMPLQHGHPDVLRRMGRPADVDRVLRLIEDLRAAMPDIALRTSFIVGYPGETEAEFSELLRTMELIAFDRVGVFQYSREDGTQAAAFPGQVAEEVKKERYDRAMQLQQGISLHRNRAQIGQEMEVLIEGTGDGMSVGRSYRDAPEIDGLVLIQEELSPCEFVEVSITHAMEYDLIGTLVA